jgi:hypothetical protein
MSSEERRKILQLVADGKISAEEAANLMRTLAETAEEEIEVFEAGPGSNDERSDAPEFEEVRKRAMRWAMIPLWAGVLFTIFSAWGMYSIQQNSGYTFWFFCLGMPLFFGVVLIALGTGGMGSRWLYVNVDRTRARDWPKNITIALPLPLGLVSWFLKNFGSRIDGLKNTTVDEVIMAISMTKSVREPLIIHVDDDHSKDGERVQIYIG